MGRNTCGVLGIGFVGILLLSIAGCSDPGQCQCEDGSVADGPSDAGQDGGEPDAGQDGGEPGADQDGGEPDADQDGEDSDTGDSPEKCLGPQTTAGPNVRAAAADVCEPAGAVDCSTPKRTMDAIAAWILDPANGIQHTNQCGEHRFALAAEQLIGEAEVPAPGEPWQGQCFSGCVQFGLMWTAVARQMEVPVRYVGTVRQNTLALLENGCWPNDYDVTFHGHYFAKFWGINGWEYYDPLAAHMAVYADGEFTKGGFQYTIFVDDACDPWDVGIHDQQDFRLLLESLYCPGGECNDPNGTCPNP